MIPQSFIQDLLARVDIVEVVGRHVKLKKAGANFLGLCPFHGEKSPSFTVSPTKQFYHCFGCGAHGSAIGFLMEHGGLGYVEAIGELAQSLGLEVPQERGDGPAPARGAPDLLDLLARAARFYRQRLKDSPRAIEYLKGRGLVGETAARFGIGYAPEGWNALQAALADYDTPQALASGLVIEPEELEEGSRRRRWDRFRDRIMFPIRNPRGQVIGFGGRVLDRGEPKYLNSPETPVFVKGRELYGLFEARDALRAHNCAIVVEGYMDVVMLAQHGVEHAVATLGTATTPDHVRKLLRLVDRVVFAFDGDAAGRRAAWRALEASLPEAADTKRIDFLFLPPEHDPDSFVREHGPQGFGERLATATPLSEFLLEGLRGRVDLDTAEGRARLVAEARPLLAALPPAALRVQLEHRLARLAALEHRELAALVQGLPAGTVAAGAPGPHRIAGHGGRDGGRTADPGAGRRPWSGRGQWAGGWRDGSRGGTGVGGSGRSAPRAPAPDLVARARLLVALYPGLAREPLAEPEWLPESLRHWCAMVGELPPGTTFAGLSEWLRARSPQDAEALLAQERAAGETTGALGAEEARTEFAGALAQLRLRGLKQEIDALADALATKGSLDADDRDRYQVLQRRLDELRRA